MRLVSKKSGEYKPVTVYAASITGKKIAPDVGWSHSLTSGSNDIWTIIKGALNDSWQNSLLNRVGGKRLIRKTITMLIPIDIQSYIEPFVVPVGFVL